MAEFHATSFYYLNQDSSNVFTITGSIVSPPLNPGDDGWVVFSYDILDVFEVNSLVNLNFNHGPNGLYTYVGYYGNGMILRGSPDYLLVTSDTSLSGTFTATSDTFITCFLEGTHVATPEGARAVEALAAGDLVLTSSGETRPVKWIGRQTVMRKFAEPLRAYPIRIAAGALGDELPTRDLLLSPDHALLIDGALVQAGALVNGTSITRLTQPGERFTYFHIELEDHAAILAEGVPAETFVDNVTRRRFDNYAEYAALHGGDDAAIAEMDLPRIKSARQLPPALRKRLAVAGGEPAAGAAA